jgi:hypothetical protein
MKSRFHLAAILALAVLALVALRATGEVRAAAGGSVPVGDTIASLIAPTNLTHLRPRGANPRVQKYVYWLATARASGQSPTGIVQAAVARAGYTNALARKLTADAMLRNLDIATKLGCLDAAGLAEMRQGKAPTVRKGPYAGDQLSVDHIVPLAAQPKLGNVIANLELLPQRLNSAKKDKLGSRQESLAHQFRRAGLLHD